jgi:hypothetical protein
MDAPEYVYTLGTPSYERDIGSVSVYRTLEGAMKAAGDDIEWEHSAGDWWEQWESPWDDSREFYYVIRREPLR